MLERHEESTLQEGEDAKFQVKGEQSGKYTRRARGEDLEFE